LPDTREPTASAGVVGGNTITPPAYPTRASLTLNGSGEGYDSEVVTYTWTMKSNPDGVLGTPAPVGTGAQVVVNDLRKAGQYTFVLTVARPNGVTKTDEVTVTVEPWVATKDIEVSFPTFVAGPILYLAPTYDPPVAGNGFVNSDVVYTVTDGLGGEWNIETGFDIDVTPYSAPGSVTFTQVFTYEDKDGNVLTSSQAILVGTATVPPPKRFSSLSIGGSSTTEITPVQFGLEKEVTEVP